MAHGVSDMLSEGSSVKMVTAKQQQNQHPQQNVRKTVGVMGSRRIFAPAFKLKVLDSYRNDIDCRGNQRATARKYGIHRRQIQKWLQCEDNLRSSCPEISPGTSAIDNSSGILKSEESTGPGISPASPALNLSLARLHGDELPVQQGPPPSHPPSRNSPSTPEFGFHTSLPLRVTPVGYTDYPNQDQHLASEIQEKIHLQDVHKYLGDRSESERKYYVSNPENYELDSPGFGNRGEVKLYQPLTPYHSPQDHRYDSNDASISSDHHLHNSQHRHQQQSHQRNYEDVDSPGDTRITRAVLHALAEIKAERASPDSAATPGLYEIPGSPSTSLVSFSSPHQTTITITNSPTPHFEPTRQTSPPMNIYIREHSHPCQPDSEKPCCQEGERREAKIEGELELKKEVEEEVVEEKHEEAVMRELVADGETREGVSCTDYQRPPAALALNNSGPTSPMQERMESYSGPSSPQGPESSGRSSSSCSDSETDAMDYTSLYQNTSGDLTRRRSFSLRFKLNVLDAFHRDLVVAGNQRATARKFGINRRQVQKWLGQETELRGEIALRGGNSRQRLGSNTDSASGESPVDLRVTGLVFNTLETHFEQPSSTLYCCETAGSPTRQYCRPGLLESPDASYQTCTFSCCTESPTMTSTTCYQETSLRRPCYTETQRNLYCYSPKEPVEVTTLPVNQELISSQLKRSACSLSCCYQATPSPKKLCLESQENCVSLCQEQPPQETPLCLVKPKKVCQTPVQIEPVTSTVTTPPAPVIPFTPSSKKDAILFKPYLDNPISKPTDESGYHGLSTVNGNNNNCQGICNLNEGRGHDYALELSLRVPVSWRTQHSSFCDFPQVRSAFVRYPASPHYT